MEQLACVMARGFRNVARSGISARRFEPRDAGAGDDDEGENTEHGAPHARMLQHTHQACSRVVLLLGAAMPEEPTCKADVRSSTSIGIASDVLYVTMC